MSSKIDKLTEKIYNEGIGKAKEQADKIIADAQKKADEIVASAKKDAEKIKSDAEKNRENLNVEVKTELKIASDQVIETVKQQLTEIIVAKTLDKSLNEALNDAAFLKSIIVSLVSNWDSNAKMVDLSVILPKDKEAEFSKNFTNSLLKELKNKIEIKFDKGFKEGFIIEPKDGNFKISFTKDDFINFFKLHLKPKVREILF